MEENSGMVLCALITRLVILKSPLSCVRFFFGNREAHVCKYIEADKEKITYCGPFLRGLG